jgi:hypothetical protein
MENKRLGSQNQAVKVSDLREAADFYRTRLAELKSKQLEKTRSIKGLDAEMEKINRQLQELRARKDEPTGEIVVSVNAKTATAARFVVSYLVNDAGLAAHLRHPGEGREQPGSPGLQGQRAPDLRRKLERREADPLHGRPRPKWFAARAEPVVPGLLPAVAAAFLGDANAAATNVRQINGRVTDEEARPSRA